MEDHSKQELERIFSALILYRHNIHVLHWNAKGVDFDPVHNLMNEYVSKFNELIDEIAEIMKMVKIMPLCLHDVLQTTHNDTENSYLGLDCHRHYNSKEIFESIRIMFASLITLYDKTINCGCLPSSIISELESHQQWFRKEGSYKNDSRLMETFSEYDL